MKHYRLAKLLFAEIALIVIVSASVVLTYTWLLPRYFNGARTPIPLLFGIVVVMLLGALLTSGGSGEGKRWRSFDKTFGRNVRYPAISLDMPSAR
jgi:hypothetical protein